MTNNFSSKQHLLPLSGRKRAHSSSPSDSSPSADNGDDTFSSQSSPTPTSIHVGHKRHQQDPFANNNNAVAENGRLQASAQRNVPVFLNKLYSMVNDPSTDNMIYWSDRGTSFIVQDREEFAEVVLPRFYKHNTFASFVRQLNMYHFHKIPHIRQGALISDSKDEIWEFSNPNFQRGQPGLLSAVARKRNKERDSEPQVNLTNVVEDIQDIRRHQASISSELHSLRLDNKILWDESFSAREKHQEHQEAIGKILQFLMAAFTKNDSNLNAAAIASAPPPAENLINEASDGPGSLQDTIKNTTRTVSSPSSTPGTASSSSSLSSVLFPASYSASSMECLTPVPVTITDPGTVSGPIATIDMAMQSAKSISDSIGDLQSTVEALASNLGIDPSHMPTASTQDSVWTQHYQSLANYHAGLTPSAVQNDHDPLFDEHRNYRHGDEINSVPLAARRASSNQVPSPVLRTTMNASFDMGRSPAPSGVSIPLSVPVAAPITPRGEANTYPTLVHPPPRNDYLSVMQAYIGNGGYSSQDRASKHGM